MIKETQEERTQRKATYIQRATSHGFDSKEEEDEVIKEASEKWEEANKII